MLRVSEHCWIDPTEVILIDNHAGGPIVTLSNGQQILTEKDVISESALLYAIEDAKKVSWLL